MLERVIQSTTNRRQFVKGMGLMMAGLTLGSKLNFQVGAQAQYGGILHCANTGEPATLDSMTTTLTRASTTGQHVFETLFTFSNDFESIPWLVDDYAFSNQDTTFTMKLRRGLLFHNGVEVTSEDVVACLKRWGEVSSAGVDTWRNIKEVTAPDKYTIKMDLHQVYAPLLTVLSYPDGGCIIAPKDIVEGAGPRPITPDNYVGTGPYKFLRWIPGDHIQMERFEDYNDRGEPIDGMGGSRKAYLDELRFYPVTEYGTRLAGLETGRFHWSERIGPSFYDEVRDSEDVEAIVLRPTAWNMLFMNTQKGIFTNQTLRQAVLAALDMEPILKNAYVEKPFYDVSGSIYPEGHIWHTKAGTEYYNQADPQRAKKLMAEANYNGEPIRYMTTMEYEAHYAQGLVIMQQLQDVGFNIDLQIFDWSTVGERRVNPELWDFFFTRGGLVPDPSINIFMADGWPGWWSTPTKRALIDKLTGTVNYEERYEAFEQLQRLMYEEAPWAFIGPFTYVTARHLSLMDAFPAYWFTFWNAWLKS